ncbi:MAG: PEGA domain-containing protein [Proteobacteria bacterium]|nr:PEGA domain-containing protein [Pseudomonadota bacterium]
MSNPSVPSLQLSDPSLQISSDPSLKAMRSNSKILQVALIFLTICAVGALIWTGYLFNQKRQEVKTAAAKEEEAAWMIKPINVQPVSINMYAMQQSDEEPYMHFSLFTTPPGADVYRDGVFLGTTPIEQYKFPKENKSSNIIIVRDGYEIARKTVSMAENFSVAVQLREVAVQAKTKAPEVKEGVTVNQAIMITTQESKTNKKGKKGGGKKAESAPEVSDIVLPD